MRERRHRPRVHPTRRRRSPAEEIIVPTPRIARIAAAAALAGAVLAGCALAPTGPHRSDDLFARVQRGMTRDEVQRIAGPPDETMAFPRTHTLAWDYRYYDTWGYFAIYSVTFGPDGRVASTISRRIEPRNR
jgi:outer membrane protein assembly factor BamE (lipoprotein component of BamABCDE complex)